jgi:hypothetical protein
MAPARSAVARAAVAARRRAAALRPYSVPERLGLAGLAAAAMAVCAAPVRERTGVSLPCPLRTLTGVPCPLCGMTTAAAELAGGHLAAALAANPGVLVVAGLTAVASVLVAARSLSLAPPPADWPASRRRGVRRAVALLLAASWAFQLHRFDWI